MFISLQNNKNRITFCSFEASFFKDNECSVQFSELLCFPPFFYSVVLYNCSVRREDCSLCKNTDQKYNCVWCDTTKSCIYRALCKQELEQCPSPKITNVRTILVFLFSILSLNIILNFANAKLGFKLSSKFILKYLIGIT